MVGLPKHEIFISGIKSKVDNILNTVNGQISTATINGKNYSIINQNFNHLDFNDFVLKAIDSKGIERIRDTELKYIFHFLENHWHLGNKFNIKIESVLYTCTSWQRYMQALKAWGAKHGKTIDFEFIAHPKAKTMIDVPSLN